MQIRSIGFLCMALALVTASAWSSDRVSGAKHQFSSPNGVEESCVALTHMPGGVYSSADLVDESRLCALDIYDPGIGICPKLRSTSPGTFIYELAGGPYAGKQRDFEAQVCARGEVLVAEAEGPPTSYKVTMNAPDTSATFSTAALLYYHFSRYFDTYVQVPVAVYRSVDRSVHEYRVTRRGLELSEGRHALRMVHAAWKALDAIERDPAAYPDPEEVFTEDRKRIYGVLLHIAGKRYGSEVNGTRKSGWGAGQSRDFQQTAPFLALRSDKPLPQAVASGQEGARRDPALRKAMGSGVSDAQMVFWMQDLTEIALLDFIFSQQDRIGNIDYLPYWHWIENGALEVTPADHSGPPSAIAQHRPLRIQRSRLNDNDAGGKRRYANFSKKTDMLEKMRHFNPETYRRLADLDQDFSNRGPLYDYVKTTFGLSQTQLDQLVGNTRAAAAILRKSCLSGSLAFDLDPENHLKTGADLPAPTAC